MLQQHLLVLLGMTARMIENRLIDLRFRDAHPVHFHSRPEFVYTLHEGKLIVDSEGRILAANRSALFQLGMRSVRDVRDAPPRRDLPDLPRRHPRSAACASSFHPVVTYRVNAAQRFFAVARRPALDEGDAAAAPDVEPAAARRVAAAVDAAAGCAAIAAPPGLPHGAPRRAALPACSDPAPGSAVATFGDARLQPQLATARRVIGRGTPVLLCGETGVGKEVFAHARARRQPAPRRRRSSRSIAPACRKT